MPFTTDNIAAASAAWKQAAGALLAPQQVDLYQGGTVTVKLHVGRRRLSEADLTAGIQQENQYATIDADDWDAKAGRPPQKGDVITWVGRRFAIEDSQTIAPAGDKLFYKSRLRG